MEVLQNNEILNTKNNNWFNVYFRSQVYQKHLYRIARTTNICYFTEPFQDHIHHNVMGWCMMMFDKNTVAYPICSECLLLICLTLRSPGLKGHVSFSYHFASTITKQSFPRKLFNLFWRNFDGMCLGWYFPLNQVGCQAIEKEDENFKILFSETTKTILAKFYWNDCVLITMVSDYHGLHSIWLTEVRPLTKMVISKLR